MPNNPTHMPPPAAPSQHPAPKPSLRQRLSTPSWILYDFSDTIFSASILTFFFPLWVTEDAGGTDANFAFALSISALLVAVTAPLLGSVSDTLNRRVPLLAICVLLCAACTALIGSLGGLWTGIALFFCANFLYQIGLVFYNSLMLNVSSESKRGVISGIGIGAGYVGLFVAFLLLGPRVEEYGNEWAFIPTAAMYVIFALPMLLIVRDVGQRRGITLRRIAYSRMSVVALVIAIPRRGATLRLMADSYRQLYATFKNARRHTNLFRFIIARLLYMEGVNTISSFYVIYLVSVGDFTRGEAVDMVTRLLIVAVVCSVATGFLVSRFGSKRVLIVGLVGWTLVVAAAAFADERWMFWAVAVVTGCFWGAPQIADRVMLTRLAPPEQVGEFFGLFQMSGRLSAVVGPGLWGLTTATLVGLGETRFRIAMLIVSLFLLGGLAVLLWVRERREESDLDSASNAPAAPQVVD